MLHVPVMELADELVEALFHELDEDGSSIIDVAELVWYIKINGGLAPNLGAI